MHTYTPTYKTGTRQFKLTQNLKQNGKLEQFQDKIADHEIISLIERARSKSSLSRLCDAKGNTDSNTGGDNTLPHTATHCTALQRTTTHCNALQGTTRHCNALQRTATHCNALQHTATQNKALQRTATHCEALHRAAMHSNTLPRMQHNAAWTAFLEVKTYCKDAAQQLTAHTQRLTANIHTHTHTHTHTHDLGTGVEPDIGSLRHTHART